MTTRDALSPHDERDGHPPIRRVAFAVVAAVFVLAVAGVAGGEESGEDRWYLLLLPAGVLGLAYAGLVAVRPEARVEPWGPPRAQVVGWVVLGLAAIGAGVSALDPAGPWELLSVPVAVVGGPWCLYAGIAGPRHPAYRAIADFRGAFAARLSLLGFGVLWPFLVLALFGVYPLR